MYYDTYAYRRMKPVLQFDAKPLILRRTRDKIKTKITNYFPLYGVYTKKSFLIEFHL